MNGLAGRWREILIAVSVVLNVFFIGMMIGAWAAGEPPATDLRPAREARAGGLGIEPRRYLASLPREERRDLRRTMVREGMNARDEFRALGKKRAAVREALLAEPFDAEAAQAALDVVLDAELALKKRSHALLVRLVNETPEEHRHEALRAAFSERRPFREEGRRPARPDHDPMHRRDAPPRR